jgi:hypothetical protein
MKATIIPSARWGEGLESPRTCILPHKGGGGENGRPSYSPHPYPGAYARRGTGLVGYQVRRR